MPGEPSPKYARIEDERRFLLDGVPGVVEDALATEIHDRYISGTRLRLRKMTVPGEPPVWKLGQKIRCGPSAARVAHTTVYLDEGEAGALALLPAAELRKLRRRLSVADASWAVDELLGPLTGLHLAEVDLGDGRGLPAAPPFPVVAEVTDDDRFSGGYLARLSVDEATALLEASGVRAPG